MCKFFSFLLFQQHIFHFQQTKKQPRKSGAAGVVGLFVMVVQQLVGLALEVAVVEHIHQGVLVGLLDGHIAVGGVQAGSTGGSALDLGAGDGLTAAHDTAAGAGHDLDEVVLLLAGLDGLQDLAGIGQAGSHTDLHIDAVIGDGELLDAVITADTALGDGFQGVGIVTLDQTAQDSLGNTAGGTEDDTAAGADAEGHIAGLGGHGLEVDTVGIDHADQLGGGQDHIGVLLAEGVGIGTLGLHLLGGTGHDGDDLGLLALGVLLVAVVLLQDGGEHLLGRAAGGDIGLELGELVLHELDPGGAAGGQQGQGAAVGNTVQELGRLLHDGQVGGVGGVVDLVEAHAVQGGDDLAHGVLALGQAEGLGHGNTDGGSDLGHHAGVLVAQGVPDLGHVVVDGQRTGGADHAALAAGDAVGGGQVPVEGGADIGLGAAVGEAQDTDALDLRADADTVAAEDALVGIADDGGGGEVHLHLLAVVVETDIVDAVLVGQLLQGALAVLVAGGAVAAVGGQQQLDDELAVLAQALGVGVDDHAVPGLLGAGGEAAAAVVLDGAQTAGAEDGELGLVAQGGDLDTGLADDGQQIFLIGKFNFFTVNRNKAHCDPSLCFHVNCIEVTVIFTRH